MTNTDGDEQPQARHELDFLAGGGEAAEEIRRHDWSATPLGPTSGWPQALRTALSMILNSKFPTYMVWGPQMLSFYNDAYAPMLGTKQNALGRPFKQLWSEAWDVVGPVAEAAMRGEASFFEDLPITLERKGYPEQTYWTFSYSPIRDERGVAGVLCTVHETTDRVALQAQLAAETERMRQMFEQAPGYLVATSGADHVLQVANAAYRSLIGNRDTIGKTVREALPELEGQGHFELLDRVFATGERYSAQAAPVDLDTGQGKLERRYITFIYEPIRNADGEVTGIFAEGIDVTEQHLIAEALREREAELQRVNAELALAAEEARTISREMDHRMKNLLTLVQALASQTARGSGSIEEFRQSFGDRLAALASAQALLAFGGGQTTFSQLARAAVEPFGGFDLHLSGEESLPIGKQVAVPVALVVHELGTNAVKHGALSAGGRVELNWAQKDGVTRIEWKESGGPPVTPPTRSDGRGLQLIQRAVGSLRNGSVEQHFTPEGLRCTISFASS